MRAQVLTVRIVVGALFLALALPAVAQNEPPKTSYSRMLNIDALIDNHARFLARRYNLSEDQDAFTQAYLRQKADEFLGKHREELFDLVDRLVEVRAGGDLDSQDLIAWGKRALPLYAEAKALITQGNDEWRGILTEEQRKVHDEDLREMYDSFVTTEDQLHRIVAGQMTLDEFRRGPARQVPRATPLAQSVPPPSPPAREAPATEQPAVPPGTARPQAAAAPGGKQATTKAPPNASGASTTAQRATPPKRGNGATRAQAQPAKAGGNPESQWEAYVREFIQRYKLDDAQTQRAQTILKDCQELAQGHLQRHKAEIEQLDKKIQSPGDPKDADRTKMLAELNARRAKLLEPIDEIFEKKLKPGLEKLPTRAQRQAAEATGKPSPTTPAKPGRPAPQPPPPQPQPNPQPPPQPVPQPPPQPVPPDEEPQPEPEPEPMPQNPESE